MILERHLPSAAGSLASRLNRHVHIFCDNAFTAGLHRQALRAAGHDVTAVVEISPRAKDPLVLGRGVLLIRFPNEARSGVGEAVSIVVVELGARIQGTFVV